MAGKAVARRRDEQAYRDMQQEQAISDLQDQQAYAQPPPQQQEYAQPPPQQVVYAQPPPQQAPQTNLTAELTRLGELHGSGVLSDAEFEAAKQKLLSS
jgi:hypothetical protein